MDQQRERIQDDLRGLVAGEVRCDDIFVQMYAGDASIYEVRPLAVICPRNVPDVVACVQYASANKLAVHARGAGSGLAGESLGPGLVLDFSRHTRRIVEISGETVRVQPGVVHAALNDELAKVGRRFGPDPANSVVTTMGSVVAIDASGSRWLRYGSARRHVRRLQVVLADGTVMEVGREPLAGVSSDVSDVADPAVRRREIVVRLADLLTRNANLIRKHQLPGGVNGCGYHLGDLVSDGHLDLAKLLAGSQGTLALITEATLATEPLPSRVGVALLMFERLENAAHAVREILPVGVTACDLIDRRHLTLARESDVRYDLLIPPTVEAVLVVECEAPTAAELRDRLADITVRVCRDRRLATDARQTLDPEEMELYWQLATRVVPRLYRLRGSTRPLPFVEDVVVPPAALAEFLVKLQNVLKQHQVTASLYGHAGHGRMHVRPFLDLSKPGDVAKMQFLADDLYRDVIELGGAIGGEVGDGLSRTWFVRQQSGLLYDVFREVKRIFDPHNTLNPGKVVADDPVPLTSHLRPAVMFSPPATTSEALSRGPINGSLAPAVASATEPHAPTTDAAPAWSAPASASLGVTESAVATGAATPSTGAVAAASTSSSPNLPAAVPPPAAPIPLLLNWRNEDILHVARNCNGCGACRSQSEGERMCPIFRFLPREEASPRAKANLMRAILTGSLDRGELPTDDFKAVADLCVHCHMCRLECPANVDIPKLMVEAKAHYVSHNGLSPTDWLITRLDLVGRLASAVSPLSNWAIGNRQARWLMEKLLGIAHGRKLPRVARRSLLRRAARRRLHRPSKAAGQKVLYFVDVYANYFDPQLGEALVAVMRHSGVDVYVPLEQMQSGMAMISLGALDVARRVAAHNVELLAEAVRQGYHVVCTEPSSALALTREYPNLLDDDEARLVAANTSEACTYLWRLHQQGKLELDFHPVNATLGYHAPCHLKALEVGSPGENLLRLIPGLTVLSKETGCSGMAGTFGLKRENYRSSLRAGWALISRLRDPTLVAGTTECSTCKIQMEQGTAKPTIHPLKLLALAYRLMPELSQILSKRGQELVVT